MKSIKIPTISINKKWLDINKLIIRLTSTAQKIKT